MPEMPSANVVCNKMSTAAANTTTTTTTSGQVKGGPDFNISSRDVEGLVMEIKENLRLSGGGPMSLKALPCSHISRKSSRASPYRIPQFHQHQHHHHHHHHQGGCGNNNNNNNKFCCDCGASSSSASSFCLRKSKLQDNNSKTDDPYELLQKLLKDGGLVSEAVRRVQLGMTPKQRYSYDSEDDNSPVLRLYPQEF